MYCYEVATSHRVTTKFRIETEEPARIDGWTTDLFEERVWDRVMDNQDLDLVTYDDHEIVSVKKFPCYPPRAAMRPEDV